MNKSKEKVKENPIVTDRAIRMANPCHRIDKVVPLYWLFDFGGNAANTEISVGKIYLEKVKK